MAELYSPSVTPAITGFFRAESQLCAESNLNSDAKRQLFCEDEGVFSSMTRFTEIVVSPDQTRVGFTIESDALSPDTVVGILDTTRTADPINFLTNYYLGNQFISFSPSGKNLVYRGSCFEGMCGLFVRDAETLEEKISFNNPVYLDSRVESSEFVQWISDDELEYKIGTELKQTTF